MLNANAVTEQAIRNTLALAVRFGYKQNVSPEEILESDILRTRASMAYLTDGLPGAIAFAASLH